MSLWLAIETATDVGSVAIGQPGTVLAELSFDERRHAGSLVPSIRELLRLTARTVTDLAGVVVADGPGSFTGLRIGFASAKGLWHAHEQLALVTLPSLMAAAWRSRPAAGGPVGVWFDALRGEVFAAIYDFDSGGPIATLAPTLTTPDALVSRAAAPAVVGGDGAAKYAEAARQWTGRAPVAPPDGAPRASALIELLTLDGAAQTCEDPAALEPTYGRNAAAQAKWEEEHGRSLPAS